MSYLREFEEMKKKISQLTKDRKIKALTKQEISDVFEGTTTKK